MQIEEHIDYHRNHQAENTDKGEEKEKSNRSGRTNRFIENQ